MKNLILIRHAKSSWDEPVPADLERPLNPRGLRDAPFMGSVLKFRGLIPDRIVSSPATRALATAQRIAAEVGYEPAAIEVQDTLYGQSPPRLIEMIRGFDDRWNRVFLVGHNPELTELVNRLAGENLANIPTCGLASLEFEVDSWAYLMAGAGRLVLFDYPKRHL